MALDLLILTMDTDPSGFRFEQAARNLGLQFHYGYYHDLSNSLPQLRQQLSPQTRLLARRPHATNDITYNYFGLFAQFLQQHTFSASLDKQLYQKDLLSLEDKMGKQWVMERAKVLVVDQCRLQTWDWSAPLIARKRFAGRSKANYVLTTSEEGQFFTSQHREQDFVYQQFYPLAGDYRVLLLGKEVLGVLHREVRIEADKRVVVRGRGSAILPGYILKQCFKIKRRVGADFLGVDVGKRKDGSYFFIEYNFSPQFLGFERETKVQVAEKVVEYLMAK